MRRKQVFARMFKNAIFWREFLIPQLKIYDFLQKAEIKISAFLIFLHLSDKKSILGLSFLFLDCKRLSLSRASMLTCFSMTLKKLTLTAFLNIFTHFVISLCFMSRIFIIHWEVSKIFCKNVQERKFGSEKIISLSQWWNSLKNHSSL